MPYDFNGSFRIFFGYEIANQSKISVQRWSPHADEAA